MPEIITWWKANSELARADVILLQEVVGTPENSQENAARTLAQALKMNYVFIPAFIHKENEKDFGVAILSAYPLSEVEKVILPHPHFSDKTQRVSAGATVSTPHGPYRIYSFHAETLQFKKWRNDQLDEVVEASRSYSALPSIIGGDFNSAPFWQKLGLLRHARKLGWEISTARVKGATFYGLVKMRLDHIFARGTQSTNAGKISSQKLSDHDALWADFQ
jgi:endonuclease/exonuclease/phosphatase family metal-dependent hydrolase